MNRSMRTLLLLSAFGISSCLREEEDKRVTSIIPGKPNEYVSIRVFTTGFKTEHQVIIIERFAKKSMFSAPTVSRLAVLDYQDSTLPDADAKLLADFSFHWQNSDSLVIHSSYLGNKFFTVSKNQLGSL